MARDRRPRGPDLYDLSPEERRDGAIMPVVRIGSAPGRPRGVLVVLGLFVLVALAIPWAQNQSAGPADTSTPRPGPTAVATPRPTPDPARTFCYEPSGWRVTAIFLWGDRTVQSWQLMRPVVATGPLDPDIVFQPFISTKVMYLGWCAPSVGDDQPTTPLDVQAWRVSEVGRDLTLRHVHAGSSKARLGGLYREPGGEDAWTPGRFVFRLSGGDTELWFGAEIILFDPDRSPAPSLSAAP